MRKLKDKQESKRQAGYILTLSIFACLSVVIVLVLIFFIFTDIRQRKLDEATIQNILIEQCDVSENYNVQMDWFSNYDPHPNYYDYLSQENLQIQCHKLFDYSEWECNCQPRQRD